MKVLELLDEIEEILADTPRFPPLSQRANIDTRDIMGIIEHIRIELPEEIQQAQWIKSERTRILNQAKDEYEAILKDAQQQAEALIENDDITLKAKTRADELLRVAEANVKEMKMSTYDYIDGILFGFQEKMEHLNARYFVDMFNDLEKTFGSVNATLADNRNEIKEMAYRTQMESD